MHLICIYVYYVFALFLCVLADFSTYSFKKNLTNHKVMLYVALGWLPTQELNKLQSEQYLSQNNSFYNQGLSPFQVSVIIKS